MSFRTPKQGALQAFWLFGSSQAGKRSKHVFFLFYNFVLSLYKRCFTCVLAFWYVRSWKTQKTRFLVIFFFFFHIRTLHALKVFSISKNLNLRNFHNTLFGSVVLFHIEYFVCIFAFWYLTCGKTFIIHVFFFFFGNVALFLYIGCFICILEFYYSSWGKTLIIHVFCNVVLFLHIECYTRVLTLWYIRSWKTLII